MAGRLGAAVTAGTLAAAAVLASASGAVATSHGPGSAAAERVSAAGASASGAVRGKVVDGQWIVVLRPGTPAVRGLAQQLVRASGGELLHTYEHALQGFSARMPAQRAEALRRNPHVLSIEPDRLATVTDTQAASSWGLDRSDQASLPLDGTYTDGNEGAGVHLYVVDTGVLLGHSEFTGRLGNGFDAVTSGGSADDCNGHGTHVAGTAAGASYGIADKAVVHPVRVLGCDGSGTTSGVIAGVDWVRAHHVKPAVANMSLGGGASSALDTAVGNAVAAGVVFAVAAGNDNADACSFSPARVPSAVTVGATTSSDARSSFSNHGSCLDLFAPGSGITSAWHTGPTATATISGTSMASPHVAGAAALHLSSNPGATPGAVRDALVQHGTVGKISGAGVGSPNVLLHTTPLWGSAAPAPAPAPLLVDGGFEGGGQGWTQSSAGLVTSVATSGQRVRTGSWAAWLGGYDGASQHLSQTVSVPSGGASLSYWWLLTSSDSQNKAYDVMTVRVHSTTGALLGTLRSRSNTAARGAWYSDTLNLKTWAARTVVLRFGVTTDSVRPSSFHIDDVAVG